MKNKGLKSRGSTRLRSKVRSSVAVRGKRNRRIADLADAVLDHFNEIDTATVEYTSVSSHGLQRAFALAHLLSERSNVPAAQRKQFQAIANLIWWAHGEPGTPPEGAGEVLWNASYPLSSLKKKTLNERTTPPNLARYLHSKPKK